MTTKTKNLPESNLSPTQGDFSLSALSVLYRHILCRFIRFHRLCCFLLVCFKRLRPIWNSNSASIASTSELIASLLLMLFVSHSVLSVFCNIRSLSARDIDIITLNSIICISAFIKETTYKMHKTYICKEGDSNGLIFFNYAISICIIFDNKKI